MLRDFHCLKCDKIYEELVRYDETGKYPDVECPGCKSKKKEILISIPNFSFANPVGTSLWNSDSKGHDYRFKHNLPNVQKQREIAKKKSHMGEEPYYGMDDVSSGKHFNPDRW